MPFNFVNNETETQNKALGLSEWSNYGYYTLIQYSETLKFFLVKIDEKLTFLCSFWEIILIRILKINFLFTTACCEKQWSFGKCVGWQKLHTTKSNYRRGLRYKISFHTFFIFFFHKLTQLNCGSFIQYKYLTNCSYHFRVQAVVAI